MDYNTKWILSYLEQLSLNNEKERFHDEDNQRRYQDMRKEYKSLVEYFLEEIQKFDETLTNIEMKQVIFRINRDVRFSKDKSPYKNNFGASLTRDWWKKSPYSWYYFHLQPWNNSFIWWWLWRPDKNVTDAVRLHLEYHWGDFSKIISKPSFKKIFREIQWRSLVRPPRWYTVDTPHLELIKMKDWFVVKHFKDNEILAEDFPKKFLKYAKELAPYNKFLNWIVEDLFV